MTDIRWGRVALAAPVALALAPVALVAGPGVCVVLFMHYLATEDWWPHPGELLGVVLGGVGYTVGVVFIGIALVQSEPIWDPLWLTVGSLALGALLNLWAWIDYRRRRAAKSRGGQP